ncbi:MAG: hypothetical protein E6K84_05290 [Thaumarchaeota archaeon]|nr:MAG: hypothetical protein E6K89_05160 [Nitrososphaerota archaeon]TLY13043.1 MAG: hypothetical protein E6K84_05290 [Nitrososphaerota archaeon]
MIEVEVARVNAHYLSWVVESVAV